MKSTNPKSALLSALLIMIAISLPFISCSQSGKDVSVDGKTFTVVTMEKGKPETSNLEKITFTGGMFDNEGCHIWGFGNGKYTATKDGENYNFQATTTSAKEGQMIWSGMVMGDMIHGDMIWKKEGQADMAYTFSSMDIKMVSLDGKVFTVGLPSGDSLMVEDFTYNNGKFESPACYEWGFTAAAYHAWESDGNIQWQSLYESPKEGKMLFWGTIKGNEMTATQLWTKEGQDDIYYTINGTLKQ